MTAVRRFRRFATVRIIVITAIEPLTLMIKKIIAVKEDAVPRAEGSTAKIMWEVPGPPTIAACVTASFTDRSVNVIIQ